MTAKEKAIELFGKYWSIQWQVHKSTKSFKKQGMSKSAAKHCALITVDEILSASTIRLSDNDNCKFVYIDDYWQEVKQEIEKL